VQPQGFLRVVQSEISLLLFRPVSGRAYALPFFLSAVGFSGTAAERILALF
jgi:hypothetical protein